MDKRMEIRLAGEGGQRMILAGIILAEAAAIYDGKQDSFWAGLPVRSNMLLKWDWNTILV